MEKNRWIILAVALVGLAGAITLSRCGESDKKRKQQAQKEALGFEKKDVVFPRQNAAAARVKKRRNGPLDTQRPTSTRASLDGLHRALGAPGGKGVVFLEVNAIRYSQIAEGILKCRGEDVDTEVKRLKKELGIDPMEDIDRLAIQEGMLAATGNFENLQIPEGSPSTQYGNGATIYDITDVEGTPGAVAVLDNNLVLMGDTVASVQGAIDRVEGRADATNTIPRGLQHAEVYGRVDGAMIGSLLSGSSDPVAARFSELVKKGFMRVNIDDEVALSLDMEAKDPAAAEDLAKAVGGALAGFRKNAADEGEHELAWLLEAAQVRPGRDGRFEIDVAVPGAFMFDLLGCDNNGNPKTPAPGQRSATPAPTPSPAGGSNSGGLNPTLTPPTAAPIPGRSSGPRGFPTVIDDGT